MPLPKLNWKMLPPYIVQLNNINVTPPTATATSPAKNTAEVILDSIFNAFSSNTYYDGTPRVTGSGVAWSFYRTSSIDISPTIKGAISFVYGFPATSSGVSQSIVFAATRSSWTNPAAGGTFGYENLPLYSGPNVVYGSVLNALLSSNYLYAFISKGADRNGWAYKGGLNSGSICNFFNSASSGTIPQKFTGSTGIVVSTQHSRTDFLSINIWESEEAIVLVGNTRTTGLNLSAVSSSNAVFSPSANYSSIFMGGAIYDPIKDTTNSSSIQTAEVDGRLYGLISNNIIEGKDHLTMENNRFLRGMGNSSYNKGTGAQLVNGPGTDSAACIYLLPNTLYGPVGLGFTGSITGTEHTLIFNPNMYLANFAHYYAKAHFSSSNIGRSNNDCSLSYNLSNLSNKSVLLPIYMTSHYNQTIIGKLRDIYTGKKMRSGMIIKSGSADYLYCISPSMYNAEECFYLKA